MRSSVPLYNTLAADYDAHFEVPHRRAYDDLAWEIVETMLPAGPGHVVDAGCGVGRWAEKLLALGHSVVGIEQAPEMASAARLRLQSNRFELIESSMEEVNLPDGQADLVLALGSLQYTHSPEQMIARFAQWVRVGGFVVVLVDSLAALVVELISAGKNAEALRCLDTRMGTWVQGHQCADNHQFDRDRMVRIFQNAKLTDIQARGLLVGASALGRQKLLENLSTNWDQQMALERLLSENYLMADLGKQLLVYGRREA